MNRLIEIGFDHAGYWALNGEKLEFELVRHSSQKNVLYAFVCDGLVKYVGKTTTQLRQRMAGYRAPAPTQLTNVRNHQRIRESLAAGLSIEILALPDSGLLHYGRFHLNLAAGLEDDIIRVMAPEWNGAPTVRPLERATDAQEVGAEPAPVLPEEPRGVFTFVLRGTYYRTGFFNVGVAAQQYFGPDGETIELRLGNSEKVVLGTINRRANGNGTPRIMGGAGLRNWFHANVVEGGEVTVQVLSPNAVRLVVGDRSAAVSA